MGKKKTKQTAGSLWRNKVRMELLVRLPSFQNAVASIRKQFEIPEGGFKSSDDFVRWQKQALQKRDANDRPQTLFDFTKAIENISRQFQLPYNFVDGIRTGVGHYIVSNKIIIPPMNFVVEQDPMGRKGTTRWFSIKTFARLDNTEIRQALADIVSLQDHYFPPTINISIRMRKNFDRDIRVLEYLLLHRSKKPIKRKVYEKGTYIEYLSRSSPAMAKKLERKNKQSVKAKYDEITAREIGKELGIKKEAVKQALARMRKLLREMFGDNLAGDVNLKS